MRNYRREMDRIAEEALKSGRRPRVLLHACCAPCFSGCFESLLPWADLTVLFYNPNMDSEEEYRRRAKELERLVKEAALPVEVVVEPYDSHIFYETVKGYENLPEGGERCFRCYELRLREAAAMAVKVKADFFTSTLSLSPLKKAERINEIGEKVGQEYGIRHLPSDFKKKDGFKRSIELSKEYGLYRQDYCGCVFSYRKDLETAG